MLFNNYNYFLFIIEQFTYEQVPLQQASSQEQAPEQDSVPERD